MYTYIYIYIYICLGVHVYMYICISLSLSLSLYIYIYRYKHAHSAGRVESAATHHQDRRRRAALGRLGLRGVAEAVNGYSLRGVQWEGGAVDGGSII